MSEFTEKLHQPANAIKYQGNAQTVVSPWEVLNFITCCCSSTYIQLMPSYATTDDEKNDRLTTESFWHPRIDEEWYISPHSECPVIFNPHPLVVAETELPLLLFKQIVAEPSKVRETTAETFFIHRVCEQPCINYPIVSCIESVNSHWEAARDHTRVEKWVWNMCYCGQGNIYNVQATFTQNGSPPKCIMKLIVAFIVSIYTLHDK